MTLPRSAADVLNEHVVFEVECIDRMYPSVYRSLLRPVLVNGYPALILRFDGEIESIIAVRIDEGRITGLYAVRDPETLSHMEQETALRR